MRKTIYFSVTCLLALFFGSMSSAMSEDVGDIYGGLSYSQTIAKDTSANNLGTYKPMTLGIGLSVIAIRNLALDGYVFTGVEDSSNDLTAARTMTVSVKDGYGFNLRPFISLSKSWSIYGKLGRQYGTQETLLKNQVTTLRTTSATFAHTVYGVGVGYNVDERWGIGLDYMKAKRIASENTDTSLISLGLRYKF